VSDQIKPCGCHRSAWVEGLCIHEWRDLAKEREQDLLLYKQQRDRALDQLSLAVRELDAQDCPPLGLGE